MAFCVLIYKNGLKQLIKIDSIMIIATGCLQKIALTSTIMALAALNPIKAFQISLSDEIRHTNADIQKELKLKQASIICLEKSKNMTSIANVEYSKEIIYSDCMIRKGFTTR